MMEVADVIKLVFGIGGGLALLLASLFGLSKLRNSKFRSLFEKVATGHETAQEQVHELEITVGKDEQQRVDIDKQVSAVDKTLEAIKEEKPKDATTAAIIDMFDKLSKK